MEASGHATDIGVGPHVRRRWGLKGKLLFSMVLVGTVPLLVGLILPFFQGVKEIQEVSGASFKGLATETARKLDLLLTEEVARNTRIATDLRLVTALEDLRDQLAAQSESERRNRLGRDEEAWNSRRPDFVSMVVDGPTATILKRYYAGADDDPGHPVSGIMRSATRALFVTDAHGSLVASLNQEVDYVHGRSDWWVGAYRHGVGAPYISTLHFDQRYGAYVIGLSIPVMDRLRYEVVGVLHRVYDARELLDPAIYPVKFGQTGHAMIIDSEGTVLSCPILPTGARLADPDLLPLVTPVEPGWVKAPSDGHGGKSTSIIGFASLPETSRITKSSTGHRWHIFVWQSPKELLSPIRNLFTWVATFGLMAVILLAALGYVAAGRIVTPIRTLQRAATLIGKGEPAAPLTVKTGDEIEDLAEEFTRMNARLQAAFAGLTDQIALKTQEAQYLREATDQILDSVPNPVVMLDLDEHIQYMNRASRDMLHLIESPGSDGKLFDRLATDPTSRARLRSHFTAYARSLVAGAAHERAEHPAAGRDPLAPPPAATVDDARRDIRVADRVFHYDWFHVTAQPGSPPRIGFVLRDTTDESRLQDQLIQAEKSGSLGVLTAGIGHELNNPLCGIFGLGEAIEDEKDLQKIKNQVRRIVQYGRRMAAIIQDFTGLAQAEARAQAGPVDLNEQLGEAVRLARQPELYGKPDIRTSFNLLPPIKATPEDIRQALFQVIKNALQAMNGSGTLSLSTRVLDGTIEVTIVDSGSGIPRPYLNKVFDPFFTTKPQGEGSGLGLTIARRIITKYGGEIRIESEEGRGTRCIIAFPVLSGTSACERRTP